jgi:micrococcal nuclease
MRPLWRLIPAAILCAASLAFAVEPKLAPGGTGLVREIVDGDTLLIEIKTATTVTPEQAVPGTKYRVRLVGIQSPKLPLGREGFGKWPLAEESKAALSKLALDHTLSLSFGGHKLDRHGRLLAQLYGEDGTWIQGEMLSQGMARVYTFADNRMLASEMYSLERKAREAKLGIWRDKFYAVRTPESVASFVGTFQLVEGVVKTAASVHGRGYLNFGEDWKQDFTVEIGPSAQSMFRQAGLDIAALSGKRIRVRGWIESYRGPLIEATHPEQIELLGP